MKIYLRRRTIDEDDKTPEFSIEASGGYAVFIVLCVGFIFTTAISWLIKLL